MEQTRTSTSQHGDGITYTTTEVIKGTFDPNAFQNLGRPGEYRVMKGIAPIERKDMVIKNASFKGLLDFVKVRAMDIKQRAGAAHFSVDTKNSTITLVLEEHGGERQEGGRYQPATTVVGSSAFTDDQKEVSGLMRGTHTPHDLAMKLRDLPHLFATEQEWKDAVSILRSLTTKVSKTVKNFSNEDTGQREVAINAIIEDGAVACKWDWKYRVYEATDPVLVPVRILYEADIDTNTVRARIHNPRKLDQERNALEKMMTETIAEIQKILGDALPFIYVNANEGR